MAVIGKDTFRGSTKGKCWWHHVQVQSPDLYGIIVSATGTETGSTIVTGVSSWADVRQSGPSVGQKSLESGLDCCGREVIPVKERVFVSGTVTGSCSRPYSSVKILLGP